PSALSRCRHPITTRGRRSGRTAAPRGNRRPSAHFRSGVDRRRDERDGPAQTGQAPRRFRDHRRTRGLAGECPSRDFGPDGGLDEIPGAGDLATDDDLRGIERVDDRREAEPEITARFRQCGPGPLIAPPPPPHPAPPPPPPPPHHPRPPASPPPLPPPAR